MRRSSPLTRAPGAPVDPKVVACAVVLAVLQLVLGSVLQVGGASFSFALVAASLALRGGNEARGAAGGFAAGLLLDFLGTGPVGLGALVGCALGFVFARREASRPVQGRAGALARFAVFDAAYHALYLSGLLLLGTGMTLEWAALSRLALTVGLDVAVCALAVLAVPPEPTQPPGGLQL